MILGSANQIQDRIIMLPNQTETVSYDYDLIYSDDDGDGWDDTITTNMNFTYNRVGDIYFELNITDNKVVPLESYGITIVGKV